MNILLRSATVLIACTGIMTTTLAQEDATQAAITNQIEAMRTVMQTERKILVMREMTLTNEEAEKFWPLYDEYRAQVKEVGNLRVKVITDYAQNYENMTDAMARQLLDDSIKFEDKKLKLEKKYIRKFRTILPEIKVTRYFQLENKLDAIVDFDLASEIPLMK